MLLHNICVFLFFFFTLFFWKDFFGKICSKTMFSKMRVPSSPSYAMPSSSDGRGPPQAASMQDGGWKGTSQRQILPKSATARV